VRRLRLAVQMEFAHFWLPVLSACVDRLHKRVPSNARSAVSRFCLSLADIDAFQAVVFRAVVF
jgi:hypothetical protein